MTSSDPVTTAALREARDFIREEYEGLLSDFCVHGTDGPLLDTMDPRDAEVVAPFREILGRLDRMLDRIAAGERLA